MYAQAASLSHRTWQRPWCNTGGLHRRSRRSPACGQLAVEGVRPAATVLHAVQLLLPVANLVCTQSTGTFLAALAVHVALRCGLLIRIHKLWYQLMTFLLREKDPCFRAYACSYLVAAESPLSWFCLLRVACQAVAFLAPVVLPTHFANLATRYCSVGLNLFMKLCLGSIAYGIVNVKITRSSRGIARKSDILGAETSRQESQVLAVGQTARVLVLLATGLWCLPNFQVNLTSVFSFCSMGGLAISLLSKGIFANLVGSFTLYLTQPFTLGDWIQASDEQIDGWVQSMGPYHTVVMRWDRRPVYIPNSRFTQLKIINASRMSNRRILLEIPLRLADLEKADAILPDIRDLIENHEAVDTEMHRLARLRSIASYAAVVWVSCYTKRVNLKDYVHAREDVLLGIKDIMFKNGTSFASVLEREGRCFDGTYTSASYNSGTGFEAIAAPAPGLSASMGEANQSPPFLNLMTQKANQKPLPPHLMTQKDMLTQEVRHLKDMQEALWKRDRDLSSKATALLGEQEKLGLRPAMISKEQSIIEGSASLEELLVSLTTVEAVAMAREDEMDKHIESVKQREDQADEEIKKRREKYVLDIDMDQEQKMEELVQNFKPAEHPQQRDWDGVKEKLAQKHEEIKQERALLLAQKTGQREPVESDTTATDASAADASATNVDGRDEDPEEQDAEDWAARAQRIAEALGGE